jgi:proline dehydrogenase
VPAIRSMIARRLAASHLAGPGVGDALRLAELYAARGWACAIGPWVAPDRTPRENLALYLEGVDALAARGLDGYISVKLSTLGYDDGMFAELLGRAAPSGMRVHSDSIGPESADRTMEMILKAAGRFRNAGATLPAGWRRSPADAAKLIEGGVAVRIVKGQWDDPAGPVADIREAYLRVARALAGAKSIVGVATHDRRVAAGSLEILRAAGTPCNMEQISGLPSNCAALAASMGVPFRVYIPYGFPYLPYNIWQVRTRPAVAFWAIRDFIAGKHRVVR